MFKSNYFVRAYLGDFFVEGLFYYTFRFFLLKFSRLVPVILVLVLCFGVEFFQLIFEPQVEGVLGRYFVGSSFSVIDLGMYTLGVGFAWVVDRWLVK